MTTTPRTNAPNRRWAGLLLAALAAVLAFVLPAGTASASGVPAAQTRVGASNPAVTHIVGVAEHIAAGQRRSRAPSQLRLVSGHCVAAEGASSGLSIGEKIAGQMGPRGWSESLMKETIDSPAATHTVWDFTSGSREAATAYARADGSYVVVNDATRAVVQVSDINKVGWKPVWDDPRFQR